jgi:sec-independent protein translocase protein TatC
MATTLHDEDLFADSRMPFTAHLEVLRWHLWRAILGLVVGMVLAIPAAETVLRLIAAPVTAELERFHRNRIRRAEERLNVGDPVLVAANRPRPLAITHDDGSPGAIWIHPVDVVLATAEADRLVNHPPALSTLSITEGFMVYFKVCLYCGVILASPWIFYQLWSFVAAGLYPHEKHLVHGYLPISLGLFLAGVAVCELLVKRSVVGFLLDFNATLDLNPDLRLSEWLGFALFLPLAFGVAFQTPVVMLALNRLGILSKQWYRQNRKVAYLALALFAALITAGPDHVSMIMLTVPLWGLYELGILFCRPESPALAGDKIPEIV